MLELEKTAHPLSRAFYSGLQADDADRLVERLLEQHP